MKNQVSVIVKYLGFQNICNIISITHKDIPAYEGLLIFHVNQPTKRIKYNNLNFKHSS